MPKNNFLKNLSVSIIAGSLLILSSTPAVALSAQATIEANEISVGETVRLYISVTGGKPAGPPEIEQPDGLQIRFLGTSQQYQLVNGRYSSEVTYTYSALAIKAGEYTLGPYKLMVNRKEILTNRINLTVTGGSSPPPATGGDNDDNGGDSGTSGRKRTNERLFLEVNLPKTKVFLGEKIPVTIRLFVGDITVRDVTYPVLNQSEVIFGKTGQPVEKRMIINGLPYQVVEFPAELVAIKAGRFKLGPVELECAVLTRNRTPDPFADFFGEYEKRPVTLKSETVEMEALPLPKSGQPAGFSGGVGHFDLAVSVSPTEVRAGDPVTVTLTVTGSGNLSSISAPRLTETGGFKVYETQRKVPAGNEETGEQVVFEQVLIPLAQDSNRIGPYHFSYFDPEQAKYRTITSEVIPITVKPNPDFASAAVSASPEGGERQYGRDLVFIKETPGRLRLKSEKIYNKIWFWLLQTLPVILLILAVYYRRRTELLNSETPKARALRAASKAGKMLKRTEVLLEKGDWERFLDELHSTIREYLGERFNLPAAGMTGKVVEKLKDEGLAEETLKKITDFFALYDFYRFTGAGLTAEDARKLRDLAGEILAAMNQKR